MKLLKDEIVTIQILRLQGETNQAIAVRLGISEGTVRYHLKRQAQKAIDGRAKQSLVEQLELIEVVEHWWNDQLENLPKDRSPNVQQLWSYLVDQYSYPGSYKSVRTFIRERFPASTSSSVSPAVIPTRTPGFKKTCIAGTIPRSGGGSAKTRSGSLRVMRICIGMWGMR